MLRNGRAALAPTRIRYLALSRYKPSMSGLSLGHWSRSGRQSRRPRGEYAGASNRGSIGQRHAALPYAEIGTFIAELQQQEGVAAHALEFAILTAARTGEVIGAAWSEI